MNKLGLLVAALFMSAISLAQNTSEQEVKKTKKVVVKSVKPPASKELLLIKATPKNKVNTPAGTKTAILPTESKKATKK
jgi:hypothetical protein